MITEITRYSECHIDWANAIKQAQTREQLLQVCLDFGDLAKDAFRVVEKMTDTEFKHEWKPGFRMECSTISAGSWNKKYGCVMFPEAILNVGTMAVQANISFGMAYNIFQQRSNFKCSIPYIDKE